MTPAAVSPRALPGLDGLHVRIDDGTANLAGIAGQIAPAGLP